MILLIANLLIVILNLVVLGFTLKLYTEILKDKAQDKRINKSLVESVLRKANGLDKMGAINGKD